MQMGDSFKHLIDKDAKLTLTGNHDHMLKSIRDVILLKQYAKQSHIVLLL